MCYEIIIMYYNYENVNMLWFLQKWLVTRNYEEWTLDHIVHCKCVMVVKNVHLSALATIGTL